MFFIGVLSLDNIKGWNKKTATAKPTRTSLNKRFKGVRAKIFQPRLFYIFTSFYLCQESQNKGGRGGVTNFFSGITRVQNRTDFDNRRTIIQHGMHGLIVKKYRTWGQRGQTILVIFRRSGSVANIFTRINLSRGIWNSPTEKCRAKNDEIPWCIFQKIQTCNR